MALIVELEGVSGGLQHRVLPQVYESRRGPTKEPLFRKTSIMLECSMLFIFFIEARCLCGFWSCTKYRNGGKKVFAHGSTGLYICFNQYVLTVSLQVKAWPLELTN